MATFMDLGCARESTPFNKERLRNQIVTACRLGYSSVAVNYLVEDLSVKTSKKGKEKPQEILSSDKVLLSDDKVKAITNHQGRPVKQHSRFSMVLSDAAQVSRFQRDENIQAYDLLSVQPTTEKLFHMACRELEIDIISLNFSERLPFFCKRASVGTAIERGIHFEICYAPMIRDSTARKNIISNANSLISVCKGKNIIISSEAIKPMELRGPYDVANLALLFGLTEAQAKETISSNCRSVLMHSAARKSQKGVLSVIRECELASKDHWKINIHNEESGHLSKDSDIDESDSSQESTSTEEKYSQESEPPLKRVKSEQKPNKR